MDNDCAGLENSPFYDGQGHMKIPSDDYFDKEGRLHKMGLSVEADKDRYKDNDPEAEYRI